MCVFLWQGKRPYMHSFLATRYKLLNEGARAKLLQLICEVAQITPCMYFWGFIYILNVDYRVGVTVQDRLPNSLRYSYSLRRAWVVT